MSIGFLWDEGIVRPMLNLLVIFNNAVGGNFGIAIILFTVFARVATFPLTIRQLHSARALQALTPKMQEIQKKHKDPRRRSEEQMKLYREAGVNPFGCFFFMLIQFPIFIALYRVIQFTLGNTPEALVGLSEKLYSWSYIQRAVPLDDTFLGLSLGASNTTGNLFLAVLVGVATWLQQKTTYPARTPMNPQQQQQQQMMLWMLPLVFGWFTLSFPAGLGVYWLASTVITVVLNYFAYGPKQLGLPIPLPGLAAAGHEGAEPQGSGVEAPSVTSSDALPEGISRSKAKRLKRMRHGRRRSKR